MPTTQELVKSLSDSQVIETTKELFNNVYTQVRYEDVRNNAKGVSEVDSLVSLDNQRLSQEMSSSDSVRFGRLMLEAYADDPELEPLVRTAMEKVQSSDDLVVGTLLALGIVVNLTLLVATTKVKVKKDADGNIAWEVNKKTAGPQLVESIVKALVKVAMI